MCQIFILKIGLTQKITKHSDYTGMFLSKNSPPRQFEVQAPGGRTPRAFGFEGQTSLSAGTPQAWEKERLHSWRVHTRPHVHWDPPQSNTFKIGRASCRERV